MNKVSTAKKYEFIIFDSSILANVDSELFCPKQDGEGTASHIVSTKGRGSVYMFQHQGVYLVLRHYCRGGMIRHVIKDSYLFVGLQSTRMWQEFHLLQSLAQAGLPVPTVIAARCVKTSFFSCRGDLITQKIEDSQTLAERLELSNLGGDLWGELGRVLARFHEHHVYHADLNANNILITGAGELYLIDFDRGELRSPSSGSSWKQENLNRLLRSFHKLSNKQSSFHFSMTHWEQLLKAYTSYEQE